jgi:WD40 repeat protein
MLLQPFKNLLSVMLVIWSLAIINQTNGQDQNPIRIDVVAWSPDGSLIAVAGGNTNSCHPTPDPSNTIFLLDSVTGQVQQSLIGSLCDVRSISWNGDGSRLVSSDGDGVYRVWDSTTGQQVSNSEPMRARGDVVWSPDNMQIANIWGDDFRVELLDATTAASLKIFGQEPRFARYKILAVDWSPDGTQLVSIGRKFLQSPDSFLHVWDVETGALLVEKDLEGIAVEVDWKPDASQIAIGVREGSISVFNTTSHALTNSFTITESPTYVKWHPFLDVLAIGSTSETFPLTIWDVEENSQRQQSAVDLPLGIGDWSPSGGRFAFVSSSFVPSYDTTEVATESVKTLVPLASLDLLEGITERCTEEASVNSELTVPSTESLLPDFLDAVTAVSATEDLTPSCVADLVAVAEELQDQ